MCGKALYKNVFIIIIIIIIIITWAMYGSTTQMYNDKHNTEYIFTL